MRITIRRTDNLEIGLKSGLALNLFVCSLALFSGCASAHSKQGVENPFPQQIGSTVSDDFADGDAYEQIVAQLVDHIEDGVQVLAAVNDADTAKQAAGMFVEASGRVVDLRQRMLAENPRDVIPPKVLIVYGPRYFFARLETEQQLKRIKKLDPEVHLPLKSVLTRLDDRVKQIEKEYEEAKDRAKQGG